MFLRHRLNGMNTFVVTMKMRENGKRKRKGALLLLVVVAVYAYAYVYVIVAAATATATGFVYFERLQNASWEFFIRASHHRYSRMLINVLPTNYKHFALDRNKRINRYLIFTDGREFYFYFLFFHFGSPASALLLAIHFSFE